MSIKYKKKPQTQTETIGDELIGEIEVLKYGSLTVPEKQWLDDELKGFSKSNDLFTELVIQLSALEKVPFEIAQKRINEGDVPDALRAMHTEMLETRKNNKQMQQEINLRYALLILHRQDKDIKLSDLKSEDIRVELIEQLADFGINESNGWRKIELNGKKDEESIEKKSKDT